MVISVELLYALNNLLNIVQWQFDQVSRSSLELARTKTGRDTYLFILIVAGISKCKKHDFYVFRHYI